MHAAPPAAPHRRQGRRAPRRRLDRDRLARRSTRPSRSTRTRRRACATPCTSCATCRTARRARCAAAQPDGRRGRAVVRLRALRAHDQRDAGACSTPSGYSMVLAEHHYDLDAEVRITEQLIRATASTRSCSSASTTTRRCSRCSKSYGRPYVLTWGVDPHAAPSEHRLRQPRRDLRDDAAPDRARPPPLRPAQRAAPPATTARRERGAGVRAALAEAGLALDERVRAVRADRRCGAAAGMMRELLALPRRGRRRCVGDQRRVRRRRDGRVPRARACASPTTSRSPASTTPTSARRRRRR